MNDPLPCPQRRRQLPAQFSWVDQRLARHHYFQRAPSETWALYLFLITVADAQGLSYYSERTLCQRLGWDSQRLSRARQALVQLQLVAYHAPLYQVLALESPPPRAPTVAPNAPVPTRQPGQQRRQAQARQPDQQRRQAQARQPDQQRRQAQARQHLQHLRHYLRGQHS